MSVPALKPEAIHSDANPSWLPIASGQAGHCTFSLLIGLHIMSSQLNSTTGPLVKHIADLRANNNGNMNYADAQLA